jgi:glycosyltransferase involved in cell wall biosynthesis
MGGVEVLAHQDAQALARAGHEVVHVTSNARGGSDQPDLPHGARMVRANAWHVVERRWHLAYPIFGPDFVSVVREHAATADVVHCHGFIYTSTSLAFGVARAKGVPRILTDHGAIQTYHSKAATFAARASAATAGRINCMLADRLVAYNDRVLDAMQRLAGRRHPEAAFAPYPVRELFVPPSAADRLAAREELGLGAGDLAVAYAGRFNPDKGADLVAQLGRGTTWRVLLQGSGDAAVLGELAPNVVALAPTDAVGVRRLYWAADVVVAPTVPGREGFPLVVREALATGVSVVSTYEPGYRRYRDVPGLHFSDRDLASLRTAVARAVESGRQHPRHDPVFNPTPKQWIENVYGGFLGLASAR